MTTTRKPPPRKGSHAPPWLPKVTRDLVLFWTGIALIVNESVFRHGPERPTFLIMYAGMVGLPAILRADELRRNSNEGP